MIGVCWNCRGLGNPQVIRLLCNLLQREGPSLVFLIETKLFSSEMERVKYRTRFNNGLYVDCRNRGSAVFIVDQILMSSVFFKKPY